LCFCLFGLVFGVLFLCGFGLKCFFGGFCLLVLLGCVFFLKWVLCGFCVVFFFLFFFCLLFWGSFVGRFGVLCLSFVGVVFGFGFCFVIFVIVYVVFFLFDLGVVFCCVVFCCVYGLVLEFFWFSWSGGGGGVCLVV